MAWERLGLVRPARDGGRRVYSPDELRWLECLREFNRAFGISLRGVAALLGFVPCWAIRARLAAEPRPRAAPAEWPAGAELLRVARGWEGHAPRACRDCGIWKSRHPEGRAAWRELTGEAKIAACAAEEDG